MARPRISLGQPMSFEAFKKEFGPKMEIHNPAKLEAELRSQHEREMKQFDKPEKEGKVIARTTPIPPIEIEGEKKIEIKGEMPVGK